MPKPRRGTATGERRAEDRPVEKWATGMLGFDELSEGGLPQERLTAVIGGPGAGKTVFALQALVNRLRSDGEASIFVSFEEPVVRIRRNIAAFDWRFAELQAEAARKDGGGGIQFIDAQLPAEAVMGGQFDLSGLLAGLSALAAETGARRVVFDGIDVLLSNLRDEQAERQELLRLEGWLRASGLSAIMTAKLFGTPNAVQSGDRERRRSDFLQFMTDCVVLLESAYTATTTSRSLRMVKYRGSGFAVNPAPLVIGPSGLTVVALRSVRQNYPTFNERVSSGIERLDRLLDGGYTRGSSVLISGSPGTSKTTLGANFVAAACASGRQSLLISFDESASQIIANMRSVGLDLAQHVASGKLRMVSLLSSGRSPEEHFTTIKILLEEQRPECLVLDPMSSLMRGGYPFSDLITDNLLDHVKALGITLLCTSLLDDATGYQELSASKVSTIADTWMHVSYVAHGGERNRSLTIIKSRGTNHSNQVRELIVDGSGVHLVDAYVAEGAVLMGSARKQKDADDRRLRAEAALAFHRAQMGLEREVAELISRSEVANQQLAWKRQEAALVNEAEALRIARAETMATARSEGRRADGPAEALNARRNRRGKKT